MLELSPAAQAVLDAYHQEAIDYIEEWGTFRHKSGLAAALRAAALYCKRDRLQLIAIASEFDSQETRND